MTNPTEAPLVSSQPATAPKRRSQWSTKPSVSASLGMLLILMVLLSVTSMLACKKRGWALDA